MKNKVVICIVFLILAAMAWVVWSRSKNDPPPQFPENPVTELLASLHRNQQQTDEEMVKILEMLLAQQAHILKTTKLFENSLIAIVDSHRRIQTIRSEIPGVLEELEKADGETRLEYFKPSITLTQLQASLSVYGLTYEADRKVGELALENLGGVLQIANMIYTIRDQRKTWFSGTQALQEMIEGLRRVRTGNESGLSIMEASSKALVERHREDLKAMLEILVAAKDILEWSEKTHASKTAMLQRFAVWMNQTIEPAQSETLKHAKFVAALEEYAAKEKKSLDEKTNSLDDVSKEIELLHRPE